MVKSFKEVVTLYTESNDKHITKPEIRIRVSDKEVIADGWTRERINSKDCGVHKVVIEPPLTGITLNNINSFVKVLDSYISKPIVDNGQQYITKNYRDYDYRNVKFQIWRNNDKAMYIRHPATDETFLLQEGQFGQYIMRNPLSSAPLDTGDVEEAVQMVCDILIKKNADKGEFDAFFRRGTTILKGEEAVKAEAAKKAKEESEAKKKAEEAKKKEEEEAKKAEEAKLSGATNGASAAPKVHSPVKVITSPVSPKKITEMPATVGLK